MAKTMFEKIWEAHEVRGPEQEGGPSLLYIDLHLVHEVTSAQAFEGLRLAGRTVRRPDRTLATVDHNVPTDPRERTGLDAIADHLSRAQVAALERNCEEFGVPLYGMQSRRQGIVHVIGPELGLSQPGITIACGDSHTSTHGALGALAVGVGTSEVEHILATQCLLQVRPRTMRITYEGEPGFGVTAKDLILGTIGQISAAGAVGHAIEYAGEPIEALSIEGRMTICNMSIEAGARAGMIAPDDVTFSYLEGRPAAPRDFDAAVERWRELPTDGARRSTRRSPSTRRRWSRRSRGAPTPARSCRSPVASPIPQSWRARRTASPRSARSPTWRSNPAPRSRTSPSTACSSGRAPTHASRTCASPPRWCAAARWQGPSTRWSSPAPSR
jgi:3-isopropylmalate/(R)-2-methylmalate dehydratase large subunit